MKNGNSLIKRIKNWEAWPFKLIYTPMSFFWLWYTVKSGHVWFFTSSNPKITFGGMEGEPKKEMYDLLPAGSFPPTFNVKPGEPIETIKALLAEYKID